MDSKKALCKRLRNKIDPVGYALLVYYGIMTVATTAVMLLDVFSYMIQQMLVSGGNPEDVDVEALISRCISNGWGYILAIAIGSVVMLLWKKKKFCFHDIWVTGRKMKMGSFFAILAVFLSGQALFQILAQLMEWIANSFGFSILESMEMAAGMEDTFSMFLYVGLFAPVFEEILFRGLVLRILEPYGKKFAIFASALLFGLFHGNLIQTPFAFAVGLVLGYAAVEYSIGWAMVLHMINNLVLGDMLGRLAGFFAPWVADAVFLGIIGIATVAAIIVCAVKRREIWHYLMDRKIHPLCMRSFFTSPGILIFGGLMLVNILITLFL